jgi:class 3 adenylate cyclase/tetratricopeptide (TPR) repeat protein
MSNVRSWLEAIGLAQYADAFEANEIDMDLLGHVDDQILKDIGVSAAGHRIRIRNAIAKMSPATAPDAKPTTANAPEILPTSAERRQLTVMFCDLVGSTQLSGRLDPEDMRAVIGAYHRCCTELIERNGGFVAKYMGDGVLAYFGYPQAHEHDAERAVRAGLALVEAVPMLETAIAGTILQVRVGIATGLVVVGDLIGSGEAQERGIVGETPNLAARLQAIAEPGTVVVAEDTRRLIGNLFELHDLGAKDLKGVAGSARAWAALRASSVESRFEALHAASLTHFVGRDEELQLLLRRWSRAKTGEGQVVLIAGEAGIGKSRLTAELLECLGGEPHTRLRYFCSPQHTDSALYPIIGQLERAAGFVHGDSPQARLNKLDALLAQTSTSTPDAALFAEMLSLSNDGRYPALDLTPQQRRHRTLEALGTRFQALAKQRPMLIIFEDIHWIDPTSLELLSLRIANVRAIPVLLIATSRPEFNPPWTGQSHVTSLTLNRLDERAAAAIVERIAYGNQLSKPVVAEIIERTDGVPLFVEEMAKAILESGEPQAAQIASVVPSPSMGVPATLYASLMARLDRLGFAREIAQIGATIGREFSYELLAAVTGRQDHELATALERLTDAGLVFQQGTIPHATFLFKHALVQDTAYSTLLRGPRRDLHARIAVVLEERFRENVAARSEVLAQHYDQAGMVDKAVTGWLRAGQQAIARSAMMEGIAQLHKGLTLLSQLPDGAQRQQYELDLQIALGRALMATRGYAAPEVGESFARARQLCDQLNRPQFVPVLYGKWLHHFLRAELDRAREGADNMLLLGEDRTDVTLKVLGYRTLGMVSFCLGDLADSRDNLERALALYDPAHLAYYATLSPSNAYLVMRLWSSRALGCLGYLDQARTESEMVLAEARRLGHSFSLTAAIVEICIAEWGLRTPEGLLALADELVSLAAEQFRMFEPQGMMFRGWCLTALGQDETELIKRSLAAFRATGSSLWVPFFLTLLADAYGMAGKPEEGLACLDEGAGVIEVTHERCTESEMHRIQGKLLLLLRRTSAAEASLFAGIEIAQRQQARLFELRAATALARLWRDQGKRQQAHDLLAPVYGWFTEGFDTLDLKEAKALLQELR